MAEAAPWQQELAEWLVHILASQEVDLGIRRITGVKLSKAHSR